jgi:hypothetical protein
MTAIVAIDFTGFARLPRQLLFQKSEWRECDAEEKGAGWLDENFEALRICNTAIRRLRRRRCWPARFQTGNGVRAWPFRSVEDPA